MIREQILQTANIAEEGGETCQWPALQGGGNVHHGAFAIRDAVGGTPPPFLDGCSPRVRSAGTRIGDRSQWVKDSYPGGRGGLPGGAPGWKKVLTAGRRTGNLDLQKNITNLQRKTGSKTKNFS